MYRPSTLVKTQHKGGKSARAHPTIFSPTPLASISHHVRPLRWDDMPHTSLPLPKIIPTASTYTLLYHISHFILHVKQKM
jgi:hypothetical protein